jgi:chaperonin GroES
LIKRIEPDRVSPGGIVIPDSKYDPITEGEVVSIGPDVTFDEDGRPRRIAINIGDRVLFSSSHGTEVTIEPRHLLSLHNLLGVMR